MDKFGFYEEKSTNLLYRNDEKYGDARAADSRTLLKYSRYHSGFGLLQPSKSKGMLASGEVNRCIVLRNIEWVHMKLSRTVLFFEKILYLYTCLHGISVRGVTIWTQLMMVECLGFLFLVFFMKYFYALSALKRCETYRVIARERCSTYLRLR